jgi:hypothetical protein
MPWLNNEQERNNQPADLASVSARGIKISKILLQIKQESLHGKRLVSTQNTFNIGDSMSILRLLNCAFCLVHLCTTHLPTHRHCLCSRDYTTPNNKCRHYFAWWVSQDVGLSEHSRFQSTGAKTALGGTGNIRKSSELVVQFLVRQNLSVATTSTPKLLHSLTSYVASHTVAVSYPPQILELCPV